MPVLSLRTTRFDVVRSAVVALLAVVQIAVSVPAGDAIGAVARAYPTPLLAAGWAFALWMLIDVGVLCYAVYQALPGQRARQVHRDTGWWMVGAAVFSVGWVLSSAAGWLPLAEIMFIGLLVALATVFGRLTRVPAESVTERVVFRGTVSLAIGWASMIAPLLTAATGVWFGLPGTGPLATIAAVVVLLAVTAIVSWAVLSSTAVVAFAAAVVWTILGTSLNDPPAAVVVAGAIAIVIVIAATARRLTTTGYPMRAAWG
jgi:hypothetical protein